MGCWNETCMLTHLPIPEGHRAAAVLLTENTGSHNTCNANGTLYPCSPLMFGDYDGYGRLEYIADEDKVLQALRNAGFYTPKTPTELAGYRGESVADYLEKANRCELYRMRVLGVNQMCAKDGRLYQTNVSFPHVYVAFMDRDFVDFAVETMLKFDQEIGVPKSDKAPVAMLERFMNAQRISWHATAGSGMQSCVDYDFGVEFYKKVLNRAKALHKFANEE